MCVIPVCQWPINTNNALWMFHCWYLLKRALDAHLKNILMVVENVKRINTLWYTFLCILMTRTGCMCYLDNCYGKIVFALIFHIWIFNRGGGGVFPTPFLLFVISNPALVDCHSMERTIRFFNDNAIWIISNIHV